jgi:hypothetical protein
VRVRVNLLSPVVQQAGCTIASRERLFATMWMGHEAELHSPSRRARLSRSWRSDFRPGAVTVGLRNFAHYLLRLGDRSSTRIRCLIVSLAGDRNDRGQHRCPLMRRLADSRRTSRDFRKVPISDMRAPLPRSEHRELLCRHKSIRIKIGRHEMGAQQRGRFFARLRDAACTFSTSQRFGWPMFTLGQKAKSMDVVGKCA